MPTNYKSIGQGVGSILGMLLRAYSVGQTEDILRKQLEEQQKLTDVDVSVPAERGYFSRVLSPRAGIQSLSLQKKLSDQLLKTQLQKEKELEAFNRQFEGQKEILKQQTAAQEYLKGIPQVKPELTEDELKLLRARTSSAESTAARNRSIVEALRSAGLMTGLDFGGGAGLPTPTGQPAPGLPGTTPEATPQLPIAPTATPSPAASPTPRSRRTIGDIRINAGPLGVTLQQPISQEAERAAAVSGARTKASAQAKREAQLKTAETIINIIDGLSAQLNTETDLLSAKAKGAASAIGAYTGMSNLPTAYNDQVNVFLGVLARSHSAEVGTLTQQDVDRVRRAMPSFYDTKQRRDFKIGILRALSKATLQEGTSREEIDSLINELTHGQSKTGVSETPQNPALIEEIDQLRKQLGEQP